MTGARTPPAARAYLLLRRLHHRLGAPADAAFAGIALGLLSPRTLHAVDEAMYAANGNYRGDAYNLGGLFPWEEEALDAWFGGRRRLVLVGAGGGREAVALAAAGRSVDAYECNPALADFANGLLARQGLEARVGLLPRDAAPAEGGPYDGAVVGWSAYMLIAGRERRIRFLWGMRERLEPGAPLLLSFWTRPPGAPRPTRVAAVANLLRRSLRRPLVEPGDDLVPNYVHSFTEDEVRGELAAAGFRMEHFTPHGPGPRDSGWAIGIAA